LDFYPILSVTAGNMNAAPLLDPKACLLVSPVSELNMYKIQN
jgi:hypothetical protein